MEPYYSFELVLGGYVKARSMEPYYSFELVLGGYVKDESSKVHGAILLV